MDKPKGVYIKHGVYYRVIRNVWHRLGTREEAEAAGWMPAHYSDMTLRQIAAEAERVRAQCQRNAKGRRKLDFNLSAIDVQELLAESEWRCAVTGVGFSMRVVSGRRPFAPSIDRIDNSKGYSKDNCRMVCAATNIALNVWGEQVFGVLARSYARRRKFLASDGKVLAKQPASA